MQNMVFVYGANEAGIHDAGAALTALRKHGAIMYQIKHSGNSYGIPTKDRDLLRLPLEKVEQYVNEFLAFAKANKKLEFQITQIGCGLAGFNPSSIAPLFKNAPSNCYFDAAWKSYLPHTFKFWGTY
jgi:hypothetical protein